MRTYPTMMKLGSFTLPKEDPIILESRDTTHEFCWDQHFFTGNQEVNFFWVFKDCFNKHGYNSDDVRKMTTPDVLKVTVFWSKGYDLILSAHDVSNKILSHNLKYIVDVVVQPNFGTSSISMREVIITSIL